MGLHLHKSLHPLTEFTPSWEIYFWTAVYPDEKNIDTMREWILKNESRLIETYSNNSRSDGGTGLGSNSLTAQYNSFNLFEETKDIPSFVDLFNFIRNEYNQFMEQTAAMNRLCDMYCWANVLRKDQQVKKHYHGAWHYSYLSGNMHFDNYETITRYYNPFNKSHFDFKNVKGGLTFFPSYLFHETTIHNQETERVSMAFDLFDKSHIDFNETNKVDF